MEDVLSKVSGLFTREVRCHIIITAGIIDMGLLFLGIFLLGLLLPDDPPPSAQPLPLPPALPSYQEDGPHYNIR